MTRNLLRRLLAPARTNRAKQIDASVLENRILYSATPLAMDGDMANSAGDAALDAAEGDVFADIDHGDLGHQPAVVNLEILDLDSLGTDDLLELPIGNEPHADYVSSEVKALNTLPTITDIQNQQTIEDKATTEIQFQIGDSDTPVSSLTVTAHAHDQDLIDHIEIRGTGANRSLVITPGSDLHGTTDIDVFVSDGVNTTTETFTLDIKATNDAPEFLGFSSVNVTTDTQRTIIDLFAAFEDVDGADSELTFEVVDNSDESLFDSITIDHETGQLILEHAEDRTGTADLQIVATDLYGLTAGWGTDENFAVYDQLKGNVGEFKPDAEAIGLKQMNLWTHWFFFGYENGRYDYDSIDVDKFTSYLHNEDWADPSVPHVFNIETEGYDNTELGRDKFAEIFAIANAERPDLDFGLYSFVPEREWHAAVNYRRALDDINDGVSSYYSQNVVQLEAAYNEWHAQNELYRTDPVSSGGTLAGKIGSVNPSLYSFYFQNTAQASPNYAASFDASANTITVDEVPMDDVQKVALRRGFDANLGSGLSPYVEYYVINNDGHSFQLSEIENGPAVDFDGNFDGEFFVQAMEYTDWHLHDRTILDWKAYAEENISEARKFDEPVYAWISPSLKGVGGDAMLDYDFFRRQLDILRPLADSIVIWEPRTHSAEFHENHEWWAALKDFMTTLDDPAAMLNITVTEADEPNATPLAGNDFISINEDASVIITASQLLGNDSDADNDLLQIETIAGPAHGSLTDLGNNGWRYTPSSNFHGTDSFSYRVSDGQADSNLATVTINVASVNDSPTATNDHFSLVEDVDLNISAAQILQNDGDIDSASLTVQLVHGPSHGSVTPTNSGFVYSPNDNFSGNDSFTYRVFDGQLNSNLATISLEIGAANDNPIAANDNLSTPNDQPLTFTKSSLLLNDRDIDGDQLQVEILGTPTNGTLNELPNGVIRYQADEGFTGIERIAYRIHDGTAYSTAEIVIDVQEGAVVETAPGTVDDHFSTRTGDLLVINMADLIGNDELGGTSGYAIEIVSEPANGALLRTLGNSYFYVSDNGFSGQDSFEYRLIGNGTSNTSTVTIDVAGTTPEPVSLGQNDTFEVTRGSSLPISFNDLMANDNGQTDNMRIRIMSLPTHGKIVIENDSVEYYPNEGFAGTDEFTYRVHDGNTVSDSISVSINVHASPVAALPVPNRDQFTGTSVTPLVRRGGAFDAANDEFDQLELRAPRNG